MESDQAPQKRRGLLGKVFIGGPMRVLRGFGRTGKTALAVKEQQQILSYARNSVGRIVDNFKALRKNRDPNTPGAPDMENFNEVLLHWGISRAELPLVIRGIRLQIVAFSGLGLLSLVGFYYGVRNVAWWPIVNGGMVFFMSAVVVVGRYWRLQVLRAERFFPFKSWVSGKVN